VKRGKRRNSAGQQISEFAAALVLLFTFFFVPLLDLGVLPIRWLLAQELIETYARQLSLSETFSQALTKLGDDPSLETKLIHLGGVQPKNIRCRLIASTVRDDPVQHYYSDVPKNIPQEWLPNGRRAPLDYRLEVQVDVEISPVFLVRLPESKDNSKTKGKIPGLNAPVALTMSATANWENLGRDPVTKNYFLNE
jgi:hypothetical protein